MSQSKIYYTITDEAPALATQSFLPIVKAFASQGGVEVLTKDISLAGRIIATMNEHLPQDKQREDALKFLGELTQDQNANIIKLPNISASIPQLTAAIKELRDQGIMVPLYPENPQNADEEKIKKQYARVLGSAVNPVLREGNSDRRVARPVKEYAKAHPHKLGAWTKDSKTRVASMTEGDFYQNEKSVIMPSADDLKIVFKSKDGNETVLRESLPVLEGEVIDATFMSLNKLKTYIAHEMENAKKDDVLFSAHLKATMMKVSDPIIFGAFVGVYFKDLFEKYSTEFTELKINPNNGLGTLISRVETLDSPKKDEILKAIEETINNGPRLAMVDSDRGITNLHVPSDVIIDASMPAMMKTSGQMWGKDGNPYDTIAMIPDRSYAGVYDATVKYLQENGAFDVSKMGSVSNVGLMAKKAEEYGSHDKTFQMPCDGEVLVANKNGDTVFNFQVEEGDIYRMCQTKDESIQDWVKLAVNRAKATNTPAIFWLDPKRGHDANLIDLVNTYLKNYDTNGLEIKIMSPDEATAYSLKRISEGLDTISVTGNVLRDYLTDLFPILELGTSAKMLSIVPLLKGGGLYETGAGGSAPKHVQQFVDENHLRWDSLGEFLALQVSLYEEAKKTNNSKLEVIANALDVANSDFLKNDKSPKRKVGEFDNRGSHFYLSLYWAKALSEQTTDTDLQAKFKKVYEDLNSSEEKINSELISAQGKKIDMGGYYHPNQELVSKAMRPSETFNNIINSLM